MIGLLALLSGCGHQGAWDFSEPFAMDVDQGLRWTIGSTIPPLFEIAVGELGGHVAEHAEQVIHFKMATDCKPLEAGHVVSTDLDGIYLCQPVLTDPRLLRNTVLHEFGHRVGPKSHRPCESKGIMAEFSSCSRDVHSLIAIDYQPGDRPFICSAGLALNARCTP